MINSILYKEGMFNVEKCFSSIKFMIWKWMGMGVTSSSGVIIMIDTNFLFFCIRMNV